MKNIYTENWEKELEEQFLKIDRFRKRAYICSPLSAETADEVRKNINAAKAYMYYAMKKMNLSARAPHAYLPMLLCDSIPAERALAANFGRRLIEVSDLILICGNHISGGMKNEIAYAAALNMQIITFCNDIYPEIKKEVRTHGGISKNVRIDTINFPMSMTCPESYIETAFIK